MCGDEVTLRAEWLELDLEVAKVLGDLKLWEPPPGCPLPCSALGWGQPGTPWPSGPHTSLFLVQLVCGQA